MAPAGLAKVRAAKKDGSWAQLEPIDRLMIPADLSAALRANRPAHRNFMAFSNSSKRIILYWNFEDSLNVRKQGSAASKKRSALRLRTSERLIPFRWRSDQSFDARPPHVRSTRAVLDPRSMRSRSS